MDETKELQIYVGGEEEKQYMKRIKIHSQVTLKNMNINHMSINNFLLKILKIISRHILPWKWNKEHLLMDAWTMKEYLLMGAHNYMLLT